MVCYFFRANFFFSVHLSRHQLNRGVTLTGKIDKIDNLFLLLYIYYAAFLPSLSSCLFPPVSIILYLSLCLFPPILILLSLSSCLFPPVSFLLSLSSYLNPSFPFLLYLSSCLFPPISILPSLSSCSFLLSLESYTDFNLLQLNYFLFMKTKTERKNRRKDTGTK